MKKKVLSILLVVYMMILGVMGLTACNDDPPPITPQKLADPVVTLNDNVATWEADSNADKFEISLDGSLSYVENSVTSKTLTDGQTLKVRAVGNGSTYSTSDWSNSVTYTADTPAPQPTKLGAPTVTISSTGLASWSAVANASSYVYKINGGAETPTTATSVQLTDGQSMSLSPPRISSADSEVIRKPRLPKRKNSYAWHLTAAKKFLAMRYSRWQRKNRYLKGRSTRRRKIFPKS